MYKTNLLFFFLCFQLFFGCESNTSSNAESDQQWWTDEDRSYILTELDRTTEALRQEIEALNELQWSFHETPDRWSIGEIVEHLEMQNQLHYREINAASNAPQYLDYRNITKGNDQHFSNYATDATKGQTQWFLEPLGRFCTKKAGEEAFYRARGKLTEWVRQTEADLRKQFTFRAYAGRKSIDEVKIGEVRDLHQLLLTGVAHTDRHLKQIQAIKLHKNFPN